ncbi:uncharacterized protein LOC105662007 [Megachile rotundata]|uniref:uncharacterized protein LOC105662007 n=1 Tax=Megachile rotundata TaxID=143995 RepID=UPI000614A9EE|nr:PREDICTED: uncharacterized protein LOC105662007 [Megachile rotundata]
MNFYLLIFCVLLWNNVQAEIEIIFDDAECKYSNDEFVEPGSCEITVDDDSEYGSTVSTHLEVIKQPPEDIRAIAKVYGVNMGEYTNDIGLDVDTNFCEVTKEHHSIARPFISAFGLNDLACPIPPGVYGMEHYVIDNNDGLPESFPIGRYLISISLLNDEYTIITVDIYLTIT